MCNGRIPVLSGLFVAVLLTSSCSDPQTQKLQHVARGDQYVAEKRDDFAVIEYASAVKIDPKFGEARFKLAQAYERMNNLPAAGAEYIRAADALPDDRTAQLKAIQVLLSAARFDDAKARAAALLAKNPKDVDVLLLHANAMMSLRDPAGALAQIEEALKVDPQSSVALARLGVVRQQSGQAKEAEAAFRRAVALDPSSADAKLGLASVLWTQGRIPEAEAAIKEALGNQPQHVLANRMLALLYVATGRRNEAIEPLKTVADHSSTPEARLVLADYYLNLGRTAEATALLTELASNPAAFAAAESRLAALDYANRRTAEAHKRLDAVLARAPKNVDALVLKAQWLADENKLDEALQRAKDAVAANPQAATAQFALGAIHDRRREVAEAIASYNEALRLNPRATAAQLALSRLSLSAGDASASLSYAEQARTGDPSSLSARAAVVRGLIAAGNVTRAETEIADLLKKAPNSPDVQVLHGSLLAMKHDAAGARRAYERALKAQPGFLGALSGLTYLDLTAKMPSQAIARLEPEIAKRPTDAPLLALAANAYNATGDLAKAEQTLRRIVSADPYFHVGYTMLANFYVQHGRMDEARAEFEGLAKRDPSNIGARTMVGILLEMQGKREEARKSFEATVAANENAAIAANNLAYIYAEQGTNLDTALQLATAAKQRNPDDPSIDDTIGWIYYKKDLPSLAVKSLEDSLRRRPDDAEVLLHLGLTYAKLGDKSKSRSALERALKLNPKVGGEEARKTLADVSR
jgi:tetratricopeptide (TPR) repeat protein